MADQLNLFGVDTLKVAREGIEAIKAGDAEPEACPCCGQWCQRYKRKLNSDMARWLVWLVSAHAKQRDWVDVKNSSVRGGDYAKLVYWGMIENKPNSDPKKKSSGFWKPTKAGIAFVFNRLTVPGHIFVFDSELLGFADTTTTIVGSIGNDFDYGELMRDSMGDISWEDFREYEDD